MAESEPDPPDPDDIVEFGEFRSYGPILSVVGIVAVGVMLVVQIILDAIGASEWIFALLAILFATLPCIAFARWVWNKPAIRLPNGKVLRQREARRVALSLWAGLFVATLLGMIRALTSGPLPPH